MTDFSPPEIPRVWVKKLYQALSRYRDDPEYEDLVQEGMLVLWNMGNEHPDEQPEALCGLAYQSVLNRAMNYRWAGMPRQRNKGALLSLSEVSEAELPAFDPYPGVLDMLEVRLLARRAGVSRDAWQMVWLYYVMEMTLEEIASFLSLSFQSAKYRLARTVARLRGTGGFDRATRAVSLKSNYRGVQPYYRRWRVKLKHRGRPIFLGCYETAEEAALVYDAAVLAYPGSLKRQLNLLPDHYLPGGLKNGKRET